MPPKSKQVEPTEPGDAGAREAEVLKGTQEIEAGADQLEFPEAAAIVNDLALHLLEQFKHRPKTWAEMGQAEQRDLFAALSANAKETVRRVTEAIARDGREPIRALLESYSEKDGIKVSLKVHAMDADESLAAVIALHKAQGKHVLITVASADDYDVDRTDPSQPEQAGLGFEAGTDEHPEDDSDLAGDDVTAQIGDVINPALKDGDGVCFAGENGHVRIDLKKGWVQFMADGDEDDTWQDMREATAEELAAERARTADFADA